MTPIRCAIYTRKSSEEGLEQSFNSLDAQREACEAYIKSQKHEGWTVLVQKYDDGGFSGGNIERPALKRLLEEVEAGRVDTIVVYKVDRLTRSLADFAKIVEKLDQRKVSFVSVTQQFNTTTSMGRLTLNVLLSFAQFEREVTGERIRDKIAASKRKGVWMGGVVPLGYDLQDRHLVPNPIEAGQVRQIFEAYLKQGCVSDLQLHLDKVGLMSKRRVSKNGNETGGKAFSRGALYLLLQNRIYLGEITHKAASYPGQHEAIIDRALWDKVQEQLKSNLQSEERQPRLRTPRFLTGKLFDSEGEAFTPTHTVKRGRRYHYYVSKIVAKSGSSRAAGKMRIPAERLERLIVDELRSLLTGPQKLIGILQGTRSESVIPQLLDLLRSCVVGEWFHLQDIIQRVVVRNGQVEIVISSKAFFTHVGLKLSTAEPGEEIWTLGVPIQLKQQSKELKLVFPSTNQIEAPQSYPALARAVARAHAWLEHITTGQTPNARALAKYTGFDERYVSRILPLAFLAPDLTEAILDGKVGSETTLADYPGDLPIVWQLQRSKLSRSL